ncbi:hypothetical protein ABEX47_04675 [Paenibacillus ehimensis]|uniref:hypothetical protein n=1 Tax=Paenibacillus ehimensis TaxID=79264 RepID=UPI000FDCA7C7|nr:hypothetical protein [Paenibacillus ehimensis]
MLSWNEDCIIYKIENHSSNFDFNELPSSSFEQVTFSDINNELIEINYAWIDPVRIRDKIISKEQKEVTFWLFKNEKILCSFANSESTMSYAINKLGKILSFGYTRINPFDHWVKNYFKKNNWFAELISVHIKTTPSAFDNNEIKKISIKSLSEFNYKSLFDKHTVTNLTFSMNNTIFYIDSVSVISFPNTIKESDILKILSVVIKEFI